MRQNLIYYCSKGGMDILGMGPSTIDSLLKAGLIHSVADIYALTVDDLTLLDNFKDKSANNLIRAIENSKNNNLNQLITALGIRNCGGKAALLLCENLGSIETIMSASPERISSISGLGETIGQSVYDYFSQTGAKDLINRLRSYGVNMQFHSDKVSSKLTGMNIVVTGTLANYSRKEIEDTIKQNGGTVTSSVSKKTKYVIVGDNPGSKAVKARELNIPILTENEFEEMIR